ncbi:MAG: sialate O-acetylesterase [Planctomycetes bacterium]|nr:sialate O-acetylesterase [Planctomycetota bacterium]
MLMLDDDHWVRAIDPVHTDKSIAGVGLCRSFARTLTARNPSITIGLIPCAVGGSALSQWEADGELYARAVKRTLKAMESGTLRGILWHHGETDAAQMGTSQTYGDRLAAMIPQLRDDLHSSDVPLLVGQLGDFVVLNPKYLFAAAINHDTKEIPYRVESTACVDPQGLGHRGDRIHFSREAVEELGKRYALAIEKLQSIQTVNAAEAGP